MTIIDTTSGIVVLDGAHAIGPSLTRAGLVASPLAAGVAPFIGRPDSASFELGIHDVDGTALVFTLRFHGERLDRVVLGLYEPDASPDDDYSVDAALAGKARQDAWLAATLGPPPYTYSWGGIESAYDPRSVSSSIVVRYGAPRG